MRECRARPDTPNGDGVDDNELKDWFCNEVLPLEAGLTRYLARACRDTETANDLRQDVYEAVLNGARTGLPRNTSAYVFAIARNLVINRARRQRVVAIDLVADMAQFDGAQVDLAATERHLDARAALRLAQKGFDRLPPRCREVVRLRKVEGLSTKEAAARMGVSVDTIERQLVMGVRAMADVMLGGAGRLQRGQDSRRARVQP